ncbi:hypothetical protein ABWL39_14970 [Chitinivorax sp. PXF-14]|uniref:hypothetical protein n=1 Tax=Chitinivorax sp. PXF-14 TaxID=3230488 RepID=UPI003467057A
MKNPYASAPRPDNAWQAKARKLAEWHEQEAAACERAAQLASDAGQQADWQQKAAWHRETAEAWRALAGSEPPRGGGFSARG